MNFTQFHQWLIEYPSQANPKPLLMGILNVTPDSFSDGGLYLNRETAIAQAEKLIAAGADIIDIGGESARPGAAAISVEEELQRVLPVIQAIRKQSDITISIDTYKPEVMEQALEAGASFINDITALENPRAQEIAARSEVPVCLMHMQGTPETMQDNPRYQTNITEEIITFFKKRIDICVQKGIKRGNLILDPGFGFGKTVDHNLQLVKRLADIRCFGLPILIGVSRKSTIGAVLNKAVEERLVGSLAVTIYAVLQGANIIRTHDVHETKQALDMVAAINAS